MSLKSKQAVIKEEIPMPEGMEGACLKGHTVLYINGMTELPEAFIQDRDFIRDIIPGESGGGLTNTGAAMVNCDQAGKPLRGFKVQKSGEGKFSTGTLFVTGSYISVNVERHGDDIHVDVTKSKVLFPENEVITVWQYNGHIDDISTPASVNQYKNAIDAALDKSMCYHCRCTHFYF